MNLKNSKILYNNEYRTPIYDLYDPSYLVGYQYEDDRRPRLNDVYIGFYDTLPLCLRGLKWDCYPNQGWHICVKDNNKKK